MKKLILNLLLVTAVLSLGEYTLVAEDIFLTNTVNQSKAIPVIVSGFTGEADSVIKFDLFVVGFDPYADPSTAKFFISGKNNGHVEGGVTDASKKIQVMAPKSYNGGTARIQAHAFANDIVQAVTGQPGIFYGKIAFRMGERNSEVYFSDFDGANLQQITHDGSDIKSPCWVPGKREILFTLYREGSALIYSYNLSTGERRTVARYGGSNYSPAASPDGSRFAFVSSKSGQMDLYVSNIDGSGVRGLTKNSDFEASPCWSPDGSKVCYSAPYLRRSALYTISAEGGEAHRIKVGGFANLTEPEWSPDGKQIVFTAQMGTFRICVVPAGGGEAKEVAEGEDPCWAPNSRTVIFSRQKNGRRVLSLLDVPTKHVKDIAQISGSCSQPSWAK